MPHQPPHWTIAGRSPLVQGVRLDLTLVLLTDALCWVSFHAAPENLNFFEPAGSIIPAALKEKT
jgi:hypothetical protein